MSVETNEYDQQLTDARQNVEAAAIAINEGDYEQAVNVLLSAIEGLVGTLEQVHLRVND